jgi:hypothetical protein
MNYLESYQFLFRSPKWLTNLLICALALFIPIIGPIVGTMVVLGYVFEIIQSLLLRGRDSYPDFDTNRLMKYLMRGAWPFLVQVVVGLLVMIVPIILLIICYFGFIMSLATLGPPGGKAGGGPPPGSSAPLIWGVLLAASVLFVQLVGILSQIVLIPMTLRAGLMQDFAAGFSWAFVRDFMGRMWGKTILAELFLVVTGLPLTLVAVICCFVPVYAAEAWVALARGYLMFELYEDYLKRGGMEIPMQVEALQSSPAADDEE